MVGKSFVYAMGTFIHQSKSHFLHFLNRRERQFMTRMIIYCHKYNMCAYLFAYIKTALGNNFTEPPKAVEVNKHGTKCNKLPMLEKPRILNPTYKLPVELVTMGNQHLLCFYSMQEAIYLLVKKCWNIRATKQYADLTFSF